MTPEPQPFDPGYDYEQDKAIEDRLDALVASLGMCWRVDESFSGLICREAASEIRALRNLIKHMERTINSLRSDIDGLRGEDE